MCKGLGWEYGNGATINFWTDSWIPGINLKQYFDPFIYVNTEWDVPKLTSIWPQHVVDQIKTIYISKKDKEDHIIWTLNGNGTFTTASARQLCNQKIINSGNNHNIFNWLWSLKIPHKLQNFMWKAITDALPTTERLNRFYNKVPNSCVLCDQADETLNHFFFECPYTLDMIHKFQRISGQSFNIPNCSTFFDNLMASISLNKSDSFTMESLIFFGMLFRQNVTIRFSEVLYKGKITR